MWSYLGQTQIFYKVDETHWPEQNVTQVAWIMRMTWPTSNAALYYYGQIYVIILFPFVAALLD